MGDTGSDDIEPTLRGLQYFIETHMEEDPELVRWHYSEAGIRDDVVAGQMDIETLTPDSRHRLSVTTWLDRYAFERGAAAYGVRDMDNGPLIAWNEDAQTPADLQHYELETLAPVEHTTTPDQLRDMAHLLRYGTPVADALAEPDLSIHRKPPAKSWIVTVLETAGYMNPVFIALHAQQPPDEQQPGS